MIELESRIEAAAKRNTREDRASAAPLLLDEIAEHFGVPRKHLNERGYPLPTECRRLRNRVLRELLDIGKDTHGGQAPTP